MLPSLPVRVWVLVALVILLAPAWPAPAGAQSGLQADTSSTEPAQLSFRTIDVEQGLPQYGVYGIAQDRFGFIWLGTLDGLARYDGKRIDTYRFSLIDPNAPASSQIWCLYADRAGVVWAGTLTGGLSSYDPRTERFTTYRHDPGDPSSLSSNAIRAIYEDSRGSLWVGTLNGGLNRLDRQTGRFTRYGHNPSDPDSLSHEHVEDIVEDERGGVWVATYGGLDRLDPATGRFTHYRHDPAHPSGLGGNQVHALLRDRSGALWVGVYGAGLYRLDEEDSGRFIAYRSDPAVPYTLSNDNVTAIVEDSAGTIWVGTYGGGLNRLDRPSGGFTHFPRTLPLGRGLPSDKIMALFPSADGLLWVGTEERGATMVDLKPKRFTIYRASPDDNVAAHPNELRPGGVRALAEDRDGTLWVGISDVGLDHLDRKRGTVTHYRYDPADPGSPINNRPQAMLVAHDGTLWVGYNGGLDRFDRAAGRFIHYRPDPGDPATLSHPDIFDLCESRDGAIWIATRGGGLNRLDPATGRFTQYRHHNDDPTSISSDSLLAVIEDQPGAIWIGTEDAGLSRLDRATGHFTHFPSDPADYTSPGSNSVAILFVDSGGTLWAAVWNSGLDRFDSASGTFTHYTPEAGLLTAKINAIQEDAAGNLWLSSNQGLTKFDPRSRATEHFTSASAGLPSGGFPLGSSGRGRSGEILLGGIDSLVTFFPEQIQTRATAVPVLLSRFLLENQPVLVGGGSPLTTSINTTSELALSYRDRVISFEFAALDYRAPQAVRYRYRLEGFDRDWIETGSERRNATYTNLDPGLYVFHVQAANGDGVWGEAEHSIRITIIPPWWRTWWFTLLTGIAVVASVAGVFRYRLQSLHARQERLEAEVAARTRELSAEVSERSRAEQAARAARDELDRQLALERELITTLDLDALLGRILEQIGQVVAYETAAIITPDGKELAVRAIRSTYLRPCPSTIKLNPAKTPPLAQSLRTSEPLLFGDISRDSDLLVYLETIFGQPVRGRSWLVAPLLAQGQVVGQLLLAHSSLDLYRPSDIELLGSFTSPIAIALQNARLHQALQNAAVLEERTRLARELHDAVTQTLFSANLIAEALPEVLRSSPARASKGAMDLRRLTAGALAEMRTLLLELRPKALTEKPLGQLLQLLCTSMTSRATIPIYLTVAHDGTLDTPAQLAFYRIAQEALNNVVKHAEAQQAILSFDVTEGEATLRVSDDGRGFQQESVRPDSLGLGIMRERAAEIGADLTITGEPGGGTTLVLHWRQAGS
ncbi:MAG: GAF domain-containing protein [Chloroflexales bacterium]|nr:GAF domain-containing protein [Chloroflexales bacterium]